jgi:hypothetical protein
MSKLHNVFLFKISFLQWLMSCMEGGELPLFMDLEVGVTTILCLSSMPSAYMKYFYHVL